MDKTDQKSPRGWHNRGYLPHFDGGDNKIQFITINLFDAIPQKILDRWELELVHEKDEKRLIELRRRAEKYLDKGYGECFLRNEKIAQVIQDAVFYHDQVRYKLFAWVIMPNHAHFLFKQIESCELSDIMHSIKSFSSSKSNKILKRKGAFWQRDYYDRYIRNQKHFKTTVAYIENNPVKAGLCKKPENWRFSSANREREHPARRQSEAIDADVDEKT